MPIAGSDFHAPDRPGRWVGSITTPPADLERLRRAVGVRTIADQQNRIFETAWLSR